MSKISVIVPVYNVKDYLRKCLDSLKNQTFKDFEAILVNDGSTDGSLDILNEYANLDSRFIVINQENKGLSGARNTGLKNAKGDFVYFLDSDDYIHHQLLEITYNMAVKNNADMVAFEFFKIKNNKQPVIQDISVSSSICTVSNSPILKLNNKKGNRVSFNVWTKLYKKSLLDGMEFIEKIKFEDVPFTLGILSKKPKTIILDKELYFYVIREASISHQKSNAQHIKDYHTGISYVIDIYKNEKLKSEFNLLIKTLIPNLLNQQLKRCLEKNNENREEMLKVFGNELRDFRKKGVLKLRGHNPLTYLKYLHIMKKY